MGYLYIKIPKQECFCVYEPIDIKKLKHYFSFFPERIVFVKNEINEEIMGIISLNDFEKAFKEGIYIVNRNFKRINFYPDYLEEVEKFFIETEYNCIPILDKKGRLIECYCRKKNRGLNREDKWLNII